MNMNILETLPFQKFQTFQTFQKFWMFFSTHQSFSASSSSTRADLFLQPFPLRKVSDVRDAPGEIPVNHHVPYLKWQAYHSYHHEFRVESSVFGTMCFMDLPSHTPGHQDELGSVSGCRPAVGGTKSHQLFLEEDFRAFNI